ncbi:MAG TPA: PASTA domain-containing protein [Balneolaceae bacterium]|nr:PASTA domain-containing protein [Balneolaceae bacterium]
MIKKILHSRKFYIAVGGLIVAFALFLFIMNSYIMPAYTNYDEGITVPDVSRLSLKEAEQRLQSCNLRYEVADRRANSAYPANYVVDQTPSPTEIVKPERKVYLTVNTATNPKVKVPNIVHLSKRNAEIQLQNYGLKVGTISFESSRFKNSVLRQSVKAGKVVPKGTVVDFAVSDGLGEKMVKIPNIQGLRLSEAQQKLQKVGLRVGQIEFQPSKKVAPNVILDYQPHKDQIVEGKSLKLIVSERYNMKEENESGAIIDTTNISAPDTTNNQ